MLSAVNVVSLGLLVISIIICYLPRVLIKNAKVKSAYPLITIFTAGIQLATVLVDLVPHMLSHGHHDHVNVHCDGHKHAFAQSVSNNYDLANSHNHGSTHKHEDAHDHKHGHSHNTGVFVLVGAVFLALLAIDVLFLHGDCASKKVESSHSHAHCHSHSHDHSHTHENLGTCNTAAISKSSSKAQALITLLAIAAHSFFEGLSLTESSLLGTFAFGLFLHKIFESFALGVSILASPFGSATQFALITFYSVLTPLGIVLAASLRKVYSGIGIWFNALSLGSLLFVVFIEMIAHSFHSTKNAPAKLAMLCVGYFTGCIAIAQAHSH